MWSLSISGFSLWTTDLVRVRFLSILLELFPFLIFLLQSFDHTVGRVDQVLLHIVSSIYWFWEIRMSRLFCWTICWFFICSYRWTFYELEDEAKRLKQESCYDDVGHPRDYSVSNGSSCWKAQQGKLFMMNIFCFTCILTDEFWS
jgi:hypothetical protein